ncbi:MAG: peroxiredoxin [Bacteroidetes bacterium]|nr:MAG: peroxiredoxin [Bacteroidota bacterium]
MSRWLKFICIAGLSATLISCSQQKDPATATICGTVELNSGSMLRLVRIDTTAYIPVDSVKPGKNGNFCLKLKPGMAGFYLLQDGNKTLVPVVLHPGDSISACLRSDSVSISGGKEAGFFDHYRKLLLAGEVVADSLGAVLSLARDLDDYQTIRHSTDSAWAILLQRTRDRGIDYLRQHKDFLSLVLVINSKIQQTFVFDQTADSAWLFLADSMLTANHSGNPHVKVYHSRVGAIRKSFSDERHARDAMKPGRTAPGITLPGPDAKNISLNTAKNKLTLVYFWTATDAPSRKANHELKALYDKYREKGFEVFAVSLDQYPDRWKAAVNLDKLWWVNVNDTKAMNSAVAKAWFVQKLPVFILTDSHGMIVDRYISVSSLEKGLIKAFGH